MAAVCSALDSCSPTALRESAITLVRDLVAAAGSTQPSLFLPTLPALLPALLACAAEEEQDLQLRELALAADEALEQLLHITPPQSSLALLAPRLPAAGEVAMAAAAAQVDHRHQGFALVAAIRSLRRVVARMQPAGLSAHLQPLLMPGLCAAYCFPLADVRKAAVDCLVAVWRVVGDAVKPHLQPLTSSQMKLLEIYNAQVTASGA